MRKISHYSSENILEEFYSALADRDEARLHRVHIPRSDVFYVREAIHKDLGERYSLDYVERAMYLEGMLEKEDCFEPDRTREWELAPK